MGVAGGFFGLLEQGYALGSPMWFRRAVATSGFFFLFYLDPTWAIVDRYGPSRAITNQRDCERHDPPPAS